MVDSLQGGTFSLEHRYRVESREDRVGFVVRYRGEQLPFERPVRIGVYDRLTDAGAESAVFDRLKESAHRAHHIDVDGALRLLDYGELDKGIPFVVSERSPGRTLEEQIADDGPLPPGDVVELVDRLASILDAVHERGLAHGTLSTRWIFTDGNPAEARLGHFLVGLTLDELRRMDGAVLTPELVRAYPPETFERDTIPPGEVDEDHDPTDEFTPHGDLFALGVCAYEALVGFHPFFDDDEEPTDASDGIVRLQKDDARPLSDFGIEEEISEVVSRAMARAPRDRWDSAGAFADALRRAHGGLADAAPPGGAESDDAGPPASTSSGEFSDLDAPSEVSEPTDRPSLEPGGPSSVLMTLIVAVLLASNVGWFFYYMDRRGEPADAAPSSAPAPSPTDEATVQLRSNPSGATVFSKDREKPLGKTPLSLPPKLQQSTPLELQVKKAGFRDYGLTLERRPDGRTLTVELREATAE